MTGNYSTAVSSVKSALDAAYAQKTHTHSGYVSATKVTSWSSTTSDNKVPSEKLVKDSLDNKASSSHSHSIGDLPTATISDGDTTHVPTCDAVYDFVDTMVGGAIYYINL